MGDESWSERRRVAGAEAQGAAAAPARAAAQATTAAALRASPAAPGSAPRFAVAGQVIGRRRTVFAAVPIAVIRPNPLQPRQHFDEETLEELAESIRARGLLQPIIVRREKDGGYTLIAGERRLRAAERAGIGLVPAILSDDDLLEVALEENVQREDLSPLEEAEALAALAAERGLSHAELAEVIHKSRPYVSNTLALTRLPRDVKQEYFADGAVVSREILISIARQETPEAMRALWQRIRLEAMSVRSFRAHQATRREPSPAKDILRGARKLNRALRALTEPGSLADEEKRLLRRALERTSRGIARVLAELDGRTKDPAGRRASGQAAKAGESGTVIPWTEVAVPRFRSSS